VVLYLDERVSERAARALEAIFLGRTGGASSAGFTAAIGEVRAVRRARIELDHSQRRPYVQIAGRALAPGRAAGRLAGAHLLRHLRTRSSGYRVGG
jgi:hypothetical protein